MRNQSEEKKNKTLVFEEDKPEVTAEMPEEEKAEKEAAGIDEAISETYYERIRREKNEEAKKVRKLTAKDILLIAIPVVVVVVILIVVLRFTEDAKWQSLSGKAHQYYNGSSSVINENTELKISDSGKIVTKDGGSVAELPIYLDEDEAFIVAEDMVYYDPRSGELKCAQILTEFELTNGGVRASRDNRSKTLNTGFLYNGDNLFVFLEPMTLENDEVSFEVPALSYVETDIEGNIKVFNYETKETESFNAEYGLTAYPAGKVYSIEIVGNAIVMPDGTRMLLFFAPEKLEKLL